MVEGIEEEVQELVVPVDSIEDLQDESGIVLVGHTVLDDGVLSVAVNGQLLGIELLARGDRDLHQLADLETPVGVPALQWHQVQDRTYCCQDR